MINSTYSMSSLQDTGDQITLFFVQELEIQSMSSYRHYYRYS